MHRSGVIVLALIAGLSMASPALAAPGGQSASTAASTHANPTSSTRTHTSTSTHVTTHTSAKLTAQEVRTLRREIQQARTQLRADRTQLVSLIRQDAPMITLLPRSTVTAAIRSGMKNYKLTAIQTTRIDALTSAFNAGGSPTGIVRAAINVVATVQPGPGLAAAVTAAGSNAQKSITAMESLLSALKASDTQIQQFITLAQSF